MNVLSLFDGISCGMLALERAGISVERYVAYEIDKYAIQISQKNYPNIEHCGDVTTADFTQYKGFDLLIGGSPCQSLSIVQSKTRENLKGKSKLFFEYVRAKQEMLPHYFLFENVASMNDESKSIISKYLGCEPILINSADFSAQERVRLYWSNIPVKPIAEGNKSNDVLNDVLEDYVAVKYFYDCGFDFHGENRTIAATLHINGHDILKRVNSRYAKCQTLTTCNGGNTQKKVYLDGRCRKLTPLEYERLQTLPDNYTSGVSDSRRYTAVGNGWTVDVIAHIFSSLKGVKTMIKCKQAMESSACGKVCCCLECEEMKICKDICSELSQDCEDAFSEEATLAVMQTEAEAVIQAIAAISVQKKQLEDQEKQLKEQLKAAMEKYDVKSFENEIVKFTYVAPSLENRLDSKALKADLPDVAAKYTKQNPKAGYVKVMVKG